MRERQTWKYMALFALLFLADLSIIAFGDQWAFSFPGNMLSEALKSQQVLDFLYESSWNNFISELILPCAFNAASICLLIYAIRKAVAKGRGA